MATQHIRLEVALEAADVVRASWELLLRRAGALFAGWCVLAAGALYFAFAETTEIDWRVGLAVLAVVFGPPAILVALVAWNAGRQFRRAEKELRPIHYCFHEDGMDVASVKRSGWIPWEALQDAVETRSAFFVFLEKDQHYLVPKRCLTGRDQVEGLRQLLAAGIHTKP